MGYERIGRKLPASYPYWRKWNPAGGYVDEIRVDPNLSVVPSQTTYSWRTRSSSEQDELDELLRVTRNGFTEPDRQFDNGHEFWTTKTSWWFSHWDFYLRNIDSSSRPYWLRGPMIPNYAGLVPTFTDLDGVSHSDRLDPFPSFPKDLDANSLGATAISRCTPTSPNASLAQFVGESIQELPRMIGASFMRDKAINFRNLGDEYLNVQFGWLPFINDIKKIVRSMSNASSLLAQFQRDSGRQVRRSYRFAPSVTSTLSREYVSYPILNAGPSNVYRVDADGTRSHLDKLVRLDRKVWFSGAFTYYLPPPPDGVFEKISEFERKADYLLGTRITPEVLWELAPWSWLVDWFSNVGDIISNASRLGQDGLVIRYGYLMVHTKETHDYSTLPGLTTKYDEKLPVFTASFSRETKRRVRATPYGFGVDLSGLSGTQLSILAALGMTRRGSTL